MCRNIRTLYNYEPVATDEEIRAASLQFVRKISGFNKPSQANAEAFARAVDEVGAASKRLLERLVTIIDNFELGLEAAKGEGERSAIYSGMTLVLKQLNDFLVENGLQPIEAEGKKFDPNVHEAIAHESSEFPEGTVIRQTRRGYRFKDRLLRPARVVISSGPGK